MIENPVEWFQGKTLDVKIDSKKKAALFEMKSVVLNSEKNVLTEISNNVRLDPVFECLKTSDAQDIELVCLILFELLNQMPPSHLLETYGKAMQKSISHPSIAVKEFILKLMEKAVNHDTIKLLQKNYTNLLVDAARCLSSPERCTAQGAISMFIKLGSSESGVNILYSDSVLKEFKGAMKVNDTSRFRVYEIVVAVSNFSAKNLTAAVSNGLMGSLISEISSADVLVQLNALEMLSNLALSNHGLSYLQECKVIQNLVDKLINLKDEPLCFVLLPGLVEFFGNLCALQPEHFTREYPQVMTSLFNSLDTSDEILLGVIISTVGKIGSSSSGRLVLNTYSEEIKYLFEKIGNILTTKNDSTVTVMNSLGELIKKINDDENLNNVSKNWFEFIVPNALESTVKLAKLPFIEFRLAALGLIKTLAVQQWGVEKLVSFPGMIEFLTDRSTEFNKDCKQTKYEIIVSIIQSPNIELILSPEGLLNLKEYIKEGPFFVPTQVEMTTEGAL